MIKIDKKENTLEVFSPYNAKFVTWARQHGGKWNRDIRAWVFPAFQEDAIRSALKRIYFWVENMEMVTVEYSGHDFYDGEVIAIGRYITVYRQHKEKPVTMVKTEIVGDSEFPARGGSWKYPRVECPENIRLQSKLPSFVYEDLTDGVKKKLVIKGE